MPPEFFLVIVHRVIVQDVLFSFLDYLLSRSKEREQVPLHSWGLWGLWGGRWWHRWPGCPSWSWWTTRSRSTPGTRSSVQLKGLLFLGSFLVRKKMKIANFCFLPAALKASFARTREANQSRTGTKKAEMFGSGFFLSFVVYLASIGSRGEQ